jgi:hypothetical protein
MMIAAPRQQNLLFFGSKHRAAGPVLFVNVHGIVISIREIALVVRQRGEAVLQALKFAAFLSVSRTLDEFSVLGCFREILPGFEHAEPFRFELSAYLNARTRGTISSVDLKGSRPAFIWPVRCPCRGNARESLRRCEGSLPCSSPSHAELLAAFRELHPGRPSP